MRQLVLWAVFAIVLLVIWFVEMPGYLKGVLLILVIVLRLTVLNRGPSNLLASHQGNPATLYEFLQSRTLVYWVGEPERYLEPVMEKGLADLGQTRVKRSPVEKVRGEADLRALQQATPPFSSEVHLLGWRTRTETGHRLLLCLTDQGRVIAEGVGETNIEKRETAVKLLSEALRDLSYNWLAKYR